MARMAPLRLSAMCLTFGIISTTTAFSAASDAAHLFSLLPRDDLQCLNTNFKQCGQGFPGNFCCSTDSTCQSLNNGKSALCCPQGRDCSVIGTISCEIQQQNATAKPLSQLFTTDFGTSLPKCGEMCCPNGMKCQGDSQCVMDGASSSSSAAASSTSKPPSAASSSASKATPNPTSATTSGSGAKSSNAASDKKVTTSVHCNPFATTGLLVGFFSGFAAGILGTMGCICCVGRRRSHKRDSGDLSSVQASVSDPIYNESANGYRADFLRHGVGATKGGNRMSRASSKVKSYFSKSPTIRSRPSNAHLTARPKTPKTPSSKREPSMESIRIYSPPNMASERPGTANTTWAEMMNQVGLKENEPYLGSPGRVDPRSRRLGEV